MSDRPAFIVGDRGSGKSVTLAVMLLAYFLADIGAALVIDPPGTLVELLLAHAIALGQESRIFVDYADPRKANGRFLQWPFLTPSQASDILVRLNEDDTNLEELLTSIFGLRGEKDGTNKPYTDKYAKLALRILRSVSPRLRIDTVLRLFVLHDEVGNRLLEESADRDAVDQWRATQLRAGRDGRQWEIETGASQRLLAILASAAICAHDGTSLDWEWVIENRKIVMVDLSGVPSSHARAFGINAYVNATNANIRLFNRTRQWHRLVNAVDEVGTMRFDTPYLINSLRFDRKAGTSWWLCTQTLTDLPTENVETILGLSDHYWHYLSSGVDRAAADICDKSYDPNAVESTTERAIHDGWEEIDTKAESKSKGKIIEKFKEKNKSESESASVSHGFRAKYRIITDVKTKNWNRQRDETKGRLSNMGIGQFIYRGMDRWEECHTQMPPDPWDFQTGFVTPKTLPDSHLFTEPMVTLYEYRLRRALNRIRSRPQYQLPQPLWNLTSNDAANPTVIPIPPRRKRKADEI
jgi:hypothetical protein